MIRHPHLIMLSIVIGLIVLLDPMWGSAKGKESEVAYFDHYAHGIGTSDTAPLCQDGIDNDSDGRTDQKDKGCKEGKAQSKALECASCHGKNGRKRMGHDECANCHNVTKILSKNGGPRVPYCRSCHLNSDTFRHTNFRQSSSMARFNTRKPEGGWSAVTLSNFQHDQHSRWVTCEHCHKQLPSKKVMSERQRRTFLRKVKQKKKANRGHFFDAGFRRVNHKACASCHQKMLKSQPELLPQMDACQDCHTISKPSPPPQIRQSQTTGFFTHKHHTEVLGAPLPCRSCHQSNGIDPKTQRVQLPLMPACQSCHNGSTSFDMGSSSCGNCHVETVIP